MSEIHQLDASVLLEFLATPGMDRKSKIQYNKCKAYLGSLKIHGIQTQISISALGEVTMKILKRAVEDMGTIKKSEEMIELLVRLQVGITSAEKETLQKAIEILRDARIQSQDAQRVAEAVTGGADKFITLDKSLVENPELQKLIKMEFPWGKESIK